MAIYRVWSGGDGTGGADNTNWAQAYATLTAAIAVPPIAGDKIYISHVTQESAAADTTWTLPGTVDLISVNKDSSEVPTAMGSGGWIGGGSGNYRFPFYAGNGAYIYGLTIRNSGGGTDDIVLASTNTANTQILFEDCYAWLGTTSSAARVNIGGGYIDRSSYIEYRNLTVRFGANQGIEIRGPIIWDGGGISVDGASITGTLVASFGTRAGSSKCRISGVDLTKVTGTLVTGTTTVYTHDIVFSQCKLHASVTPKAATTNKASPQVWVVDCSDDAATPSRGIWGYYDGLGSLTKETGIYKTDGATGWAWKAVGSANASYQTPFTTPWVQFDNTVNTAITPRFEIFRDASTTAYTDAQVWAEWAYKQTSGSDQATFTFGDRQALSAFLAGTAGVAQATGAGTGGWETGSGADWSGKVDSGGTITAAEDGVLKGRVAVTGAITVYIDPQIRT